LMVMVTRRKFDRDFKEGAVRLVRETGKPIAQVAKEQLAQPNRPGRLAERDVADQVAANPPLCAAITGAALPPGQASSGGTTRRASTSAAGHPKVRLPVLRQVVEVVTV
jgi:hypothetical protein